MKIIATVLLWAHILITAVVFGGSVYETIVINSVWWADLPGSLAFMTGPNAPKPGRFWMGLGGIPALAALAAFVSNLFVRERRWLVTIAFVCIVINVVTTIFYFVPILMVIFSPDGGGKSGEELTQLALNWKNGTWGRMFLLLVSLALSIVALGRRPRLINNKVETQI